jgi:hypothetical protein
LLGIQLIISLIWPLPEGCVAVLFADVPHFLQDAGN